MVRQLTEEVETVPGPDDVLCEACTVWRGKLR